MDKKGEKGLWRPGYEGAGSKAKEGKDKEGQKI